MSHPTPHPAHPSPAQSRVEAGPRPFPRAMLWALALLGGLIVGLWLAGTPPGLLGKADAIGYAICHRIDERSFHAHDRALPLCARCTGIYLGAVATLIVAVLRGRARANHLPPVRVLVALVLLGALYAFDGLNSYLSLFPFYRPLYEPHNTLRLLTGMTFGVALIMIMLPVYNMMIWRGGVVSQAVAPARTLRELLPVYAAGGAACAALLAGGYAVRVALGLVSAAGVLLIFVILGSVMFLTVTRRENSLRRWRDLGVPSGAGLVFAIAVIGAIDLARYVFTGTWNGFTF